MRLGNLHTAIAIRTEGNGDRAFRDAQDLGKRAAATINAAPFVGFGNVVEYTFTVVGALTIPHKLDRKPQGWMVVRLRDAAPTVYESASDENTLTLTSSGAGRVSVWVY